MREAADPNLRLSGSSIVEEAERACRAVQNSAETILQRAASREGFAGVEGPPAIELLIGDLLPHVFEKHFKRPFGASAADEGREAVGPGIRFV
jgi:hypothetical protein